MAGRTLIDGVYKTIKGGNALVDGVSKKIKCGKVLIDGVSHNIPLANVLTLTTEVSNFPIDGGYVTYNGKHYPGETLLVSAAERVVVTVTTGAVGSGWSDKMYVKLNRTIVAQGAGFSASTTYTYTPASDATIKFICSKTDGTHMAIAAEIVES